MARLVVHGATIGREVSGRQIEGSGWGLVDAATVERTEADPPRGVPLCGMASHIVA
jgi:hypothetical protein